MKTLNSVGKWLLGVLVVTLLAGVWVSPAAAQAPERDFTRLEYGLKLAVVRAEAVQARIDTTTAAADIAEEFIADEQAKGFDTTKLEAALAALRTQIDQAQTLQSTAARLLADKPGFDAEGQVVDPQQARQTLQTAHRTLQNADQTLRRARQDFRQAVQDYRLARRQNQ